MAEIIDRRFLLIQKFLALREKYGVDHAESQFSQKEHDDMFNYIIASHTSENQRLDGSCVIPKSL